MPNFLNVSALVTKIQLCSHYFLDHPRRSCIVNIAAVVMGAFTHDILSGIKLIRLYGDYDCFA